VSRFGFFISLLVWALIPYLSGFISFELGLLFIIYYIYIMYTLNIHVVLREVRNTYGILVGNQNVRLLVRSKSEWDNQLKWTVKKRSVVRWAGFNWLLIQPSVRSGQGICRLMVSVSLSEMTLLGGVCWSCFHISSAN
jgi:hypothetical protein